jgi:hypothetical protein
LSEDRGDTHLQAQQDDTPLLKRVLIGAIMGAFLAVLEFGFPAGFSSGSILMVLLSVIALGGTFGSLLGVASCWLEPEDRFKWFYACCIAGGSAGGVSWLIEPSASLVVVVGAGVLLGAIFYLAG